MRQSKSSSRSPTSRDDDSKPRPSPPPLTLVDASSKKTNNHSANNLTESEIEEVREAFNLFDVDGSGTIDPRELREAMKSLGYDAKNQVIADMIADLDRDGTGEIDFDEFLDIFSLRMGGAGGGDSKEEIQKIFNLFDDEKKGYISLQNLKRVARCLGENMSDADLLEMIERADTDNDGLVSLDDFYHVMTKATTLGTASGGGGSGNEVGKVRSG